MAWAKETSKGGDRASWWTRASCTWHWGSSTFPSRDDCDTGVLWRSSSHQGCKGDLCNDHSHQQLRRVSLSWDSSRETKVWLMELWVIWWRHKGAVGAPAYILFPEWHHQTKEDPSEVPNHDGKTQPGQWFCSDASSLNSSLTLVFCTPSSPLAHLLIPLPATQALLQQAAARSGERSLGTIHVHNHKCACSAFCGLGEVTKGNRVPWHSLQRDGECRLLKHSLADWTPAAHIGACTMYSDPVIVFFHFFPWYSSKGETLQMRMLLGKGPGSKHLFTNLLQEIIKIHFRSWAFKKKCSKWPRRMYHP